MCMRIPSHRQGRHAGSHQATGHRRAAPASSQRRLCYLIAAGGAWAQLDWMRSGLTAWYAGDPVALLGGSTTHVAAVCNRTPSTVSYHWQRRPRRAKHHQDALQSDTLLLQSLHGTQTRPNFDDGPGPRICSSLGVHSLVFSKRP